MQQTVVATSHANLDSQIPSPDDGQPAIIRIGSGQSAEDIELIYHSSLSKWIGVQEYDILRCTSELISQPESDPGFTTKQILDTVTEQTISSGPNLWWHAAFNRVDLAWAAGLTLQYRHHGMMRSSRETTSQKMNAGAVFFLCDDGDTYDTTYANAWAETSYLNGGISYTAGLPLYQWEEAGWTTLQKPGGGTPDTPTSEVLYAELWGYMDGSPTIAGGVNSYTCWLRWVI